MSVSVALCIVAYFLCAALSTSYPIRKRRIQNAAGDCILKINRTASPLFFVVLAVAPAVITLVLLRSFGVMMDGIFCACAVLSLELIFRDRIAAVLSGVYKNALIADGKIIFFSDVLALPTLAWEEDAETCALKIVSKKDGEFSVQFENAEERKNTVSAILEAAPNLRP